MRPLLIVAAVLALAPPAAATAAPSPTRDAPIVVGDKAISLGALEARTRQARPWHLDRDLSRAAAAAGLIAEAQIAAEARRRGIRVRGRSASALERRVALAIGERARGAKRFVARFRAYQRRWDAVTRCTPYWSVADPCAPEKTFADCLWFGPGDICAATPDPPARPFWGVTLWAEAYGIRPDRSGPLARRLRARIRRVDGLRARLGEILVEGDVIAFAEDEGASELVAREAYRLWRSYR